MSEKQLAFRVGLTVQGLRSYVAGAQRVAGLDSPGVMLTLRRPRLMRSVPVSTRSRTVASAAAIPARGCKFTKSVMGFTSTGGIELWGFSVIKYWCWNSAGRRADANPKVRIIPKIRQAAAVSGWRYEGLDKNGQFDTLFRWNGAPGGAEVTVRRGVFRWCPPRVFCVNTREPEISITGYYDGHVTDSRVIT